MRRRAPGLEKGYLQVREHAQQAPQQAAVDGLAAALSLDKQQDAVDGLALDLQVADDVEPKELQAHVPETHTHSRPGSTVSLRRMNPML